MLRSLAIVALISSVVVLAVSADGDCSCSSCGSSSSSSDEHKVCRNVRWSGGDSIDWPCPATRQLYRSNKKFISKNMLATRVAVHDDTAFLAFPRFKTGIPFTLAKVSLTSRGCEASVAPFPSWSLQEEGNCAALQSVVDVFLDPRDILWALDTGIVDSLDCPVRRCSPKVVAVNARTGKVVKTIDLSPLTTDKSRLQYVVADHASNGHVFIYVSDAASRAILVFDVTSGRGYRVILPKAVTCGATRRDVLSLALIRRPDGSNCLLFTYFSGSNLFSIRTDYLQSGQANGRVNDLGPKRGKVVFLGTDNGSAIFFRHEGESDVYRWDLLDTPTKENIHRVFKGKSCELPTHVVPDYNRSRMRLLESNFPDYFQATVGCGANQALSIF